MNHRRTAQTGKLTALLGAFAFHSMTNLDRRLDFEQRTEESEDRFRALAEAPFDGVIIHIDGIVAVANRTIQPLGSMAEPDWDFRSAKISLSS